MQLFFSPSSLGYLFGSVVCWVGAWRLYKSYKKSHLEETRIFSIGLVYLGITAFLYAFPTFFFSEKPYILGWFNVAANFFMGIWLAYMLKLGMMFNFLRKVIAKRAFYLMLFWTVFILVPINIIFLPLPTFDKYGLEIWNYEWPLFLNTGLAILLVLWFLGASTLYRMFKGERRWSAFAIAIAFIIGGFGACLITYADTTLLVAVAYITTVIGGFAALAVAFMK